MQKTAVMKNIQTFFPFWDRLEQREQDLLRERAGFVRYQTGQHIRTSHSDCLGLMLVVSGALRAYLLSPDGREITLYRIKEGETCVLAASCALDAVSFETQVDAEEDSEVLLIPIDAFASLMKNNVHVECFCYKKTTERFSDVVAGVERLVFMNLEQRLASFLLDEAAGSESDTIHMTHEQIALNIGTAREVVSRTLKSMSTKGLVELFRGGVRLMDRPALYQIIQ